MSNLLIVTLTTLLSYVVAEGENTVEKKPMEGKNYRIQNVCVCVI